MSESRLSTGSLASTMTRHSDLEMRLPAGGAQQRTHQQEHCDHESFVDDRVGREHRIGTGPHVVDQRADGDVETEDQEQLPHADAECG